jgi:thiosulfate/3-mercaptopyruvate sulfurtransferase
MKFRILPFVVSSLIGITMSYGQTNILVSPQWLSDHLHEPGQIIIQVNFLKLDYNKEHIAGAGYLWPELLAPNTPEANFNSPDVDAASRVLQTLGISNNSTVILYHARNEVSVTARMFLTLENLGLRGRVRFLNGGLEAWKKAGYPVTTAISPVQKGNFKAKPLGLMVDKDYVLKTLQSTNGVVVDARMKRFYDGEPTGNPRDGHITGAKNIPFTEMVDAENVFKPVDSLQRYFAPVAKQGEEIVTYCFIGQTACVVYMAGRILGYDVKLYDNSLQEWSRNEALPMEKTP